MMKKALVLALAAVACAAWFASSELPELGKGDTDAASGGVAGFPSDRAGVSAARPRTFATLPDRGDLVSYPTPSPARVDGAYTWHRAELSEEHAFQSLQTGSLRITSPSGRPLEFEYSRHVEHPSGDWTWIGRLKGGKEADEAVITFGERAAFGAIAEPGKPNLRLTTSAGVAWLVETDPRKISTIDSEATRPTRPDYLMPPEQQASPAASQPTPIAAASAPTPSAAVAAAAATTVDVVVGYTTGFAAALGGQSQAVTRLNNMVEIANEAYRNSQVDAGIRMVHALQVNYPDNTSNADTLEKLTGYRSGSGQVPVDPAFTALRAARDQYGGDLVTLVRRFQTPENDGCGIAWLLGGGQTGIDAGDAPFGYSVVADSNGRLNPDTGTDGKSYFCRDETLAHELGHNMGSQHDRATATENGQLRFGVYAYSFGYRADSTAGNFYTVMAYGDTGQGAFRVFSSPRTTFCGGYPCGVADQADNARSLSLTAPIVAAFRARHMSGRRDFNRDGRDDILWFKDGVLCLWFMNGATLSSSSCPGGAGVGYRIVATADFNGDGNGDILWTNGWRMEVWFGDGGGGFSPREIGTYDSTWFVAVAADMNSDGRGDILMQKDGLLCLWFMNGSALSSSSCPANAGPGYRFVAAADFNNDGHKDILLTNGWRIQVWTGNGDGAFSQQIVGNYDSTWTVATAADMNSDGMSDILLHKDGIFCIWFMNGSRLSYSACPANAGLGYRVVSTADFNGDGSSDVLWTNGWRLQMWYGNAVGGVSPQVLGTYDGSWSAF